MALVSPGVEVTIIDESQYTSAGQNTVPFLLIATAQDKLNPAGELAQGTLEASSDDLYLITSQRELVNTFGNPIFYKTAGGDAIHGHELNEYGLMAAYSVLGTTNRLYVQRVNVDLAELEGSLVRPSGAPNSGAYWLDLNETAFGLFVWNSAKNAFDLIDPLLITDPDDLDVGVPAASVGQIGQYAVVTLNANNPVYYKTPANEWVLLGSDEWKAAIPTIVGTQSNPTLTAGDDFSINATPIAVPASPNDNLAGLVGAINLASIPGVTAGVVNNRLEIYVSEGTGSETSSTDVSVDIAAGTINDLLGDLGLTAGTFYAPIVAHESHVNIPRWRTTDTTPRPSGSIWVKTTAVNEGAHLVLKRYDGTTESFLEQAVPLYANDWVANKHLDPGTGGKSIPSGDTYAQFDVNDNDTATLKIFSRNVGVTSITGITPNPTVTAGQDFTMEVSEVNSTALTAPVVITTSGVDAASLVTDILSAGLPNIEASVDANGRVNITHNAGGVIRITDTGGQIAAVGINPTLENVRTDNSGRMVLSNWVVLTYTADVEEPGQDPVNGTRWYYSDIGEVDIMIHEGGVWKGYRNVSNDVRGHDLTLTDPAGPTIAPLAPEEQSDGSPLVYGDLWIDTSDLENFPLIYRWQQDQNGVDKWTLVDNADQTTTEGVLFADARWANNGTTNPITGDLVPITTMLQSDYLDLDAPDPDLYPDGMLLWNLRRSSYNVKEFRLNYFNSDDFTGVLPDERNTWVTVSGYKDDGSANMGRLAQRSIVVEALRAAIDTNTEVREEQRRFNLMACPGYPELIPNMVALNNERANTAFIIGDTPMRLPNTGAELVDWATNNGGLGLPTNDGLTAADEYLGVFYPSGRTNDLEGTTIMVPPSHMILRTFIHSDEQSYPWIAPAGVRRGIIDNANSIGYLDATTGEFKAMATRQGIRDVLYTNNVNPIMFEPGVGYMNYGNKTTKPGSALDRINVSRLVSYIRVLADQLGRQFVFEPNDKITRDELKGQMERMLNDLIAKRGIYDYLVVCDESNNTPVRIDRNELWCDIAIEPVKAAEFIYIPVRVKNTGEISGQ